MTQKIKAKIHAQEAENQQRPYLLCDSALPLPVALSPLRSRELGLLIPVLTISMLTGHYQRAGKGAGWECSRGGGLNKAESTSTSRATAPQLSQQTEHQARQPALRGSVPPCRLPALGLGEVAPSEFSPQPFLEPQGVAREEEGAQRCECAL